MSAVKSPMRKMTVMPELLKMAQLAHQHRVAQVQVGSGGVEAGLYAQRAAGFAALFQAFAQVGDADDLRGALFEQVHLFVYGRECEWCERGHAVISIGSEQPRSRISAEQSPKERRGLAANGFTIVTPLHTKPSCMSSDRSSWQLASAAEQTMTASQMPNRLTARSAAPSMTAGEVSTVA